MIFDSLNLLQADSILGLMTAFREDPSPDKVDLSVGIYRAASGQTPVLRAVKRAEALLIDEQTTKAYVAPIGVEGFRSGIRDLVLGEFDNSLSSRVGCLQTPGGCGALRVAAELYLRARPEGCALVSTPTWNNHFGLLGGAGIEIRTYPYYDPESHVLNIDHMLESLREAPPESLVVLQVSCHNPTGADPDTSDWDAILDVIEQRAHLPLFDLAYQGMGTGLDADVAPIRRAVARLPEALAAVSTSKNFGLYRERTGALLMVAENASQVETLESQVKDIARGIYSMSPSHGALIVERILKDSNLRAEWLAELGEMRSRIELFRRSLKEALASLRPDLTLDWLVHQRGMFSMLGISAAVVDSLRQERHIYMVRDSRINIAGLNDQNLALVADAIAPHMN